MILGYAKLQKSKFRSRYTASTSKKCQYADVNIFYVKIAKLRGDSSGSFSLLYIKRAYLFYNSTYNKNVQTYITMM